MPFRNRSAFPSAWTKARRVADNLRNPPQTGSWGKRHIHSHCEMIAYSIGKRNVEIPARTEKVIPLLTPE